MAQAPLQINKLQFLYENSGAKKSPPPQAIALKDAKSNIHTEYSIANANCEVGLTPQAAIPIRIPILNSSLLRTSPIVHLLRRRLKSRIQRL